MIATLDDFIREYRRICGMGWIPTHRHGPTGVGKTLEDLLGIHENNHRGSDFNGYELKSSIGGSSPCTLLTDTPLPENAINILLERFGNNSGLYKTLRTTTNAGGIWLCYNGNAERFLIIEGNNQEFAYWNHARLRAVFSNKYPRNILIYARAQRRTINGNDEFHYIEADKFNIDYEQFINLLERGRIKIELRIARRADGTIHDHGTAFRISKNNMLELDHHRIFPSD